MTLAELFKLLLFPRPMWGVWLPGIGWLRNAEGKPYADGNKGVAQAVAKRLKNGSRVEYIDTALSDISIERMFLNVEKDG